MGAAVLVVIADIYAPKKKIDTISSLYFGVLIGVLLTYVLSVALAPLLTQSFNAGIIQLLIGLVLCYLCTSVLLHSSLPASVVCLCVVVARGSCIVQESSCLWCRSK